jgi:3-oxoacyl-[acyl-carrier protein] reductase
VTTAESAVGGAFAACQWHAGCVTTGGLFKLDGKVAIVTGAGSADGIGFASARALAALGARVVIASTTERIHERAEDLADLGGEATGVVADLTTADGVDALIAAARQMGQLDIVVNNAGMTSVGRPGVSGSIDDLTIAQWRDTLEVNVTTAFSVCRAALPLLRENGYGRIVNIASVTGPVMAMRGEVAYAAAKAAMVGLTRALALDLAHQAITVNAVAPGWIDTASSNEHERTQGVASPMQRSGRADEIAGAVAWLASPSGGYITGQVITIDGGNSIAEERA